MSLTMPSNGSNNSSPIDFAFEPPAMSSDSPFDPYKSDKTPYTYTPNNYSSQSTSMPAYGYSSASSFSSTSGSATGSSFSSADALPAISRDFVRPSPTETRRPATAGGALQSRSPFAGFMGGEGERFQRLIQRSSTVAVEDLKPAGVTETIEEEGVFANPNPFASPPVKNDGKPVSSQTPDGSVDPYFASPSRRASEPQFGAVPQQSPWTHNYTANPYPLATPAQISQTQSVQPMNVHSQHFQQQMVNSTRPQTSDGLPRYAGVSSGVSLPSARTIVNQIDGYSQPFHKVRQEKTMQPSSLMPFRDARAASMGNLQVQPSYSSSRTYSMDSSKTARPTYINQADAKNADLNGEGELTFVPLGGPAPKKRPRRRFDEIERLYTCGWGGCEKAYGTLNHLNAHVAMQKHGEKRLPSGEYCAKGTYMTKS